MIEDLRKLAAELDRKAEAMEKRGDLCDQGADGETVAGSWWRFGAAWVRLGAALFRAGQP